MNGPGIIGPGGGRVGAVMLSPYIRPGTVSMVPYNHYSFLRSVEDIFQLAAPGVCRPARVCSGFGTDLYTSPRARDTRRL